MTTTSYMPARPRPRNGVLLLFLQMPLGAVVGGYLLAVVSLPVASFAVFVASAAFPAWVSHRTAVSKDPREPVHHLHRYAVLALGVVTVCTVAMAAASAVTGIGSSGLWRRLGAALTGEPSSGSWALLAGVVVCTLVATCTVVSAQVLFGGGLSLGRPALTRVSDGLNDAIKNILGDRGQHARTTMDPAARSFRRPDDRGGNGCRLDGQSVLNNSVWRRMTRAPARRARAACRMALCLGVVALIPAPPAVAIIGGNADGYGHPYVGTMDASYFGRLDGPTGVLISPTVLLTAGHVTRDWEEAGLRARVTFDPVRSSTSVWRSGTVYTSPAFDPQRADDPGDLGVVVFDEPVTNIRPALLPRAGLLDAQGVRGLKSAEFEVVGYGVSRFLGGPSGGGQPHPDRASAGTRLVANQTFNSLTAAWLRLQQHEDGSICVGDSGSPSLFAGTDMIAGITVGGFGQCRNTVWDQRIDTPAAREFLSHHVALP